MLNATNQVLGRKVKADGSGVGTSYRCPAAVRPACGSEPGESGHAPDDLFDSVNHGGQITVTTGGRIELEAEWEPFRVQCHRKADPGDTGGVRRMRVPGQEDVCDVLNSAAVATSDWLSATRRMVDFTVH